MARVRVYLGPCAVVKVVRGVREIWEVGKAESAQGALSAGCVAAVAVLAHDHYLRRRFKPCHGHILPCHHPGSYSSYSVFGADALFGHSGSYATCRGVPEMATVERSSASR